MNYYVETFRLPYPAKGVSFQVHSEKLWKIDACSPDLTSLFLVRDVPSRKSAIALLIECSGKASNVEKII
jgi:hypothetical protein